MIQKKINPKFKIFQKVKLMRDNNSLEKQSNLTIEKILDVPNVCRILKKDISLAIISFTGII
jgi:hypothetical protein